MRAFTNIVLVDANQEVRKNRQKYIHLLSRKLHAQNNKNNPTVVFFIEGFQGFCKSEVGIEALRYLVLGQKMTRLVIRLDLLHEKEPLKVLEYLIFELEGLLNRREANTAHTVEYAMELLRDEKFKGAGKMILFLDNTDAMIKFAKKKAIQS